MENNKKHCLSIAGHDPTNGAGFSSDVVTFSKLGVSSLSVCTAITYQNNSLFSGVNWMPLNSILKQLDCILGSYSLASIKLGLIESLDVLCAVLNHVNTFYTENPEFKKPFIIWDPILSASTGFNFHKTIDDQVLKTILKNIHLITPNLPEAKRMFPKINWELNSNSPLQCAILLKGGHKNGNQSIDVLYTKTNFSTYQLPRLNVEMHGTGCVLSSAISANIALGNSLENSVEKAKLYLYNILQAIVAK